MYSKNKLIINITLSGMFIAIGIVLPFLTGQIPEIGSMLCPMHIPVMICGFMCGWKYGLIVGFTTPLLRTSIFSMPVLYPHSISMAFELATYGLLCGLIFDKLLKIIKRDYIAIIITLLLSMISGRIIWGIVRYSLSLIDGSNIFNIKVFVTGAFITAWPGILIQIILIPTLIITLMKLNIIKK